MFVRLKDLDGDFVVCNIQDIECIYVGKIDRKGNTATIVRFQCGGYFCVSEHVSEVAERIGSSMFLTFHDDNLSEIVFNIGCIECVFSSLWRKTKGQNIVECSSGNCYTVFEDVSDIYKMLMS